MKKFWYLLLIPLFMGLAACSDDDDDDDAKGITASNIIGTWELANVKGSMTEDGKSLNFDVDTSNLQAFEDADVADYVRFEFTSNGLVNLWEYEDGKWLSYTNDETVRYTLQGNKLTLSGTSMTEVYIVKSLEASKMVLHGEEREGNSMLIADFTFKKIK